MKIVTEKAVRDMVRIAMFREGLEDDDAPVEPNANVDPSKSQTDPLGKESIPRTKQELSVAINVLSKDLDQKQVAAVYGAAKDAVNKDKEGREMSKQVESLRKLIRTMIAEARAMKGPGEPPMKLSTMTDVEGASFEEIAEELGLSVAGAHRAVEHALKKAQFVASMDTDDHDLMVLEAIGKYITYLESSGELDAEDVAVLKANPTIVGELDGFREFLHNHIRRAQKDAGKTMADDWEPEY